MGKHKTSSAVLPETLKRNLTQAADENCTVECYGEELIGRIVKIWWPQGKTFVRGKIKYFDSDQRMHMVDYDMGVKELLDLSEERWQLEQGTDKGCGASNTMVKHVGIRSSDNSKRKHVEAACQDAMNEKGKKEVVIEKELNSHKDQAIHQKTAAADSKIVFQSSEHLKRQKTPSPRPGSSGQDRDADACTELVDVGGYLVKASFALILGSIFSKYGDIASNCLFKNRNTRIHFLELVCTVVRKLQSAEFGVSTSEVKEMISEISDAAEAKLDVSWLQKFLEEEINLIEQASKKSSDLMEVRANSNLIVEAAREDMEHRRMEAMAAKKQFMEAKNRWKALEHVKAKIEKDVEEFLAPKQAWRRRVDELL